MKLKLVLFFIGIALIVLSYMSHYFFFVDYSECGSGAEWPLYISLPARECKATYIPHPLMSSFLLLGILAVAVSWYLIYYEHG